MAGYRPCYTYSDDKKIIDYIITNKAYAAVKGNMLWKAMEEKEILDRTWQSMKERYRKKIYPNLHSPQYDLSKEEQENLRLGYSAGEIERNTSRAQKVVKDKKSTSKEWWKFNDSSDEEETSKS